VPWLDNAVWQDNTVLATPPTPSGQPVPTQERYRHYYRPCPYEQVDIYRVLLLFGVTDPCLQHAIKKLMVAGGRGAKDISRDVEEAIVTLRRWQAMRQEESGAETK